MGDMIFLLDGGTPAVIDEGKYFYIWVYEEKTWKEVTKEEYEKLKDEEYNRKDIEKCQRESKKSSNT